MAAFEYKMTSTCEQRCYVEQATACVEQLQLLVRPLITIGSDFEIDFDFCGEFRYDVDCYTRNVIDCPADDILVIQETFTQVTITVDNSCPDPCAERTCSGNGRCVADDLDSAHCVCFTAFTGDDCERMSTLYYYGPRYFDYTLIKSESGLFVSTAIEIPTGLHIFNKRYDHIYIAERGYITMVDKFFAYLFTSLPTINEDLIMLAPLYANQDIYCGSSAIFYHIYSSASQDSLTRQVLARASDEMTSRYSLQDFSATTVVVITWYNTQPFNCETYQRWYGVEDGSTYQLVIAADSLHTFASYRYDEINVGRFTDGELHIGYRIGTHQETHEISGGSTVTFNDLQETELDVNSVFNGVWYTELFDDTIELTDADRCIAWATTTVDLSLDDYYSQVSPCPCNYEDALFSGSFIALETEAITACFLTTKIVDIGSSLNIQRECCYLYLDQENQGPLVTSNSREAGTLILSGTDDTTLSDEEAYQYCCQSDEDGGSNRYCLQYYLKRPVDDCAGFNTGISAIIWGDPHIQTLDGFDYTFNGIGEYFMVKTFDDSFTLQARTSQMQSSSGALLQASKWSAFAARMDNEGVVHTVQIEMNSDETALIATLDGSSDWENTNQNDPVYIVNDQANGFINASFSSGWRLDVGLNQRMLAFVLTVPDSARGNTRGLLGTYTDNTADDLTKPDGIQLSLDLSTEDIHYEFGLEWQVNGAESVFEYPSGETFATYRDLTFVPQFEPECTAADDVWVSENCGESAQCRFDYCVTKDEAIAIGTRDIQDNYIYQQAILNNSAPSVSAPQLIQVEFMEEIFFFVSGSDAEDEEVDLEIIYEIDGATFDPATGEFRWTPTDATSVEIIFMARDSLGSVSSAHTVEVHYCSGCNDNGVCNYDVTSPVEGSNTFRAATCDCNAGWRGVHCQTDSDGCQFNNCENGQICIDVIPQIEVAQSQPYTCNEPIECADGEEQNNDNVCVDVNECATGNGGCQHTCVNEDRSFSCECNAGYMLNADGHSCDQINECSQDPSPCVETCTDTDGGYECSCAVGGTLQSDGSCLYDNDCSIPCSYNCLADGQTCICQSGYELADNGIDCIDEDECMIDALNDCEYQALCQNTAGSYTCGCPTGYEVNPANTHRCQPCSGNTYGENCAQTCSCGGDDSNSYTCHHLRGCECAEGYSMQDGECADVDECLSNPNNVLCGDHSSCVNNVGSYACVCDTGYEMNIHGECVDVDECRDTPTICSSVPNSYCVNQPAGHSCECNLGFVKVDGDCNRGTVITLRVQFDLDFDDFGTNQGFLNAFMITMATSTWFQAFRHAATFVKVESQQVFRGSTIVQFDALYSGDLTNDQVSAIGQDFAQRIAGNSDDIAIDGVEYPVISAQYVDPVTGENVNIEDACFIYNTENTCGSNGVCEVEDDSPTCRCSKGYGGDLCDDKDEGEDSTPVIAIVMGCIGAVLLIAVVCIGVCLYCRHQQTPKKVLYRRDQESGSGGSDMGDFPSLKRAPRHYPSWYQSVWPFRYFASPPPSYATNPYATQGGYMANPGYATNAYVSVGEVNAAYATPQPLYGVYE